MPKIPLDNIHPGMRLAKPVMNENGMILLNEDTELTDILIERLKGMNLDGVFIKGMSKPSVPKENMLSDIDKRFKMVENEPYMGLLRNILVKHIEGLYE